VINDRLAPPEVLRRAKLYKRLQAKTQTRTFRRRAVRLGLVGSNLLILGVIMFFVMQSPKPDTAAPLLSAVSSAESNPLDEISSVDIAMTVAQLNNLPESTAVANQAQSQAAEMEMAVTDNNVVSKPQIVETTLKSSADIEDYAVQAGDTISSIAAKFGVTSDSIRWSNNLTGEAVAAGSTLVIPPVNGIVYTIAAGDTAESLAAKFNANKDKIIAYNDAEIKGLVVGQRVLIPDGTKTAAPVRSNPSSAATGRPASAFAWGTSAIYGYNGYDYGYCTWYVANRISVPNNWGNANTWDNYAPSAGWRVAKTPVVGSIAQDNGGYYGHVAVVDAVSADGSMIKYSDMNGIAGWGREGHSDWVAVSRFDNYIYR
jgi:N-acetylmuramoyl-L-alanine amidase